jgi:hypothetical protein
MSEDTNGTVTTVEGTPETPLAASPAKVTRRSRKAAEEKARTVREAGARLRFAGFEAAKAGYAPYKGFEAELELGLGRSGKGRTDGRNFILRVYGRKGSLSFGKELESRKAAVAKGSFDK